MHRIITLQWIDLFWNALSYIIFKIEKSAQEKVRKFCELEKMMLYLQLKRNRYGDTF